MPTYCYSTPSGELIEEYFPFGKAPREIVLPSGMVATRDFGAEHNPRPAGGGWPLECVGSGVNAEQAGELREYFVKHGVPTEVSKDGNPIYRDPHHRKRALACRGFIDRSSYC
jgi:hypothetical protein